MAGLAGYGAQLLLSDGDAAPEYNVVANVTSITGPALSLDVEDVTSHDSTAAWEEVVPTIIRSGELTLEINYNPASPMHMIGTGAGAAITAAIVLDETFTIAGDYSDFFVAGVHFRVEGSTGNDDSWEVSSSVFGAATVITVTGDVTDATADGTIVCPTLAMSLSERVELDCILIFPDAGLTEWAFSGYVTKFEPGVPHDGKLTASVGMKLTGVPTLV